MEKEYVGRCGYYPDNHEIERAELTIPPSVLAAYEATLRDSNKKQE